MDVRRICVRNRETAARREHQAEELVVDAVLTSCLSEIGVFRMWVVEHRRA